MIERYLVVAGRIRQEIADVERAVERAEKAMGLARKSMEDDLYVDSAALNLHDFYSELERIFRHIATVLDRAAPDGPEWHRELLRQMSVTLPGVRPEVLSRETYEGLDEYLRFRHVVRNVYAFEFDRRRVDELTRGLRPLYERVRRELLAFADFLEQL